MGIGGIVTVDEQILAPASSGPEKGRELRALEST
jgi:hypothetical protein